MVTALSLISLVFFIGFVIASTVMGFIGEKRAARYLLIIACSFLVVLSVFVFGFPIFCEFLS